MLLTEMQTSEGSMQRSGSTGFEISDEGELTCAGRRAGGGGGGGGSHDWISSGLMSDPSASYEIGIGASARVYAVRHPQTQETFAVKRMDRSPLSSDPTRNHSFQKEVDLFSKLRHPNIIQLLAVRHEPDCHLLIMELADSELKDELDGGALPEPEAAGFFGQIAAAVHYCHTQSICHRDLKLENVMLMQDGKTVTALDPASICVQPLLLAGPVCDVVFACAPTLAKSSGCATLRRSRSPTSVRLLPSRSAACCAHPLPDA